MHKNIHVFLIVACFLGQTVCMQASQAPKKPQEIQVTILNESGLPVKAGISIKQIFPPSTKAFLTSAFPYTFSFETGKVLTISVDPGKEHIQEWGPPSFSLTQEEQKKLKQTPVLILTIVKDPQAKQLKIKKQFGRELSTEQEQKKTVQVKEKKS